MISAMLLAGNIVLSPFNNYLGEMPTSTEVCDFSYGPSTTLAPGTRLKVSPSYSEHYGPGSVIMRGDGMTCGNCAVHKIEHTSEGETMLYCDGPEAKRKF